MPKKQIKKTKKAQVPEKPKKHPGGRPSPYRPSYAHIAEKACRDAGFTDRQLADLFDVALSTITKWKHDYPEFSAQIKNGKDSYNTGNVENSLLRRALGYEYTEKTTEAIVDKDGKIIDLKKVRNTKKEMAPDTTAQIFWLKNRQPDRWRDVKGVQLTGKGDGPIETVNINGEMTAEQAQRAYAEMIRNGDGDDNADSQ